MVFENMEFLGLDSAEDPILSVFPGMKGLWLVFSTADLEVTVEVVVVADICV